jgi:hypothetical protein
MTMMTDATSSTAKKDTADMDILKIIVAVGGGGLVSLSAGGFWALAYRQTGDSFFAWMGIMVFIVGCSLTTLAVMPDRK